MTTRTSPIEFQSFLVILMTVSILVSVLLCLKCPKHRKKSKEEKERERFLAFQKRHMLPRAKRKPVVFKTPEKDKDSFHSCTSDHPYEDLSSVCASRIVSPEVCARTNATPERCVVVCRDQGERRAGPETSHLLTVQPGMTTYISFTHSLSAVLHSVSTLDDISRDERQVSLRWREPSTVFFDSTMDMTYIIPDRGPRIRVTRSSLGSLDSPCDGSIPAGETTSSQRYSLFTSPGNSPATVHSSSSQNSHYESIDPAPSSEDRRQSDSAAQENLYESLKTPPAQTGQTSLKASRPYETCSQDNHTGASHTSEYSDNTYETIEFPPRITERSINLSEVSAHDDAVRYSPFPVKAVAKPNCKNKSGQPKFSLINIVQDDSSDQDVNIDMETVDSQLSTVVTRMAPRDTSTHTTPHTTVPRPGRRSAAPVSRLDRSRSQSRLSRTFLPSLPSVSEDFEVEMEDHLTRRNCRMSTPNVFIQLGETTAFPFPSVYHV